VNKSQLKKLAKLRGDLEQAQADFREMHSALDDSYNNKSEKWQEGDKGQEAKERLDELETFVDNLETLASEAQDLIDKHE
jgi:hypothetical protein